MAEVRDDTGHKSSKNMKDRIEKWRESQSFTLKLFLIGFLIILAFIPMGMVKGVVQDRMKYRNVAVQDVEKGWAYAQTILGPILVQPYTETKRVEYFSEQEQKMLVRKEKEEKRLFVFPETLITDVDMKTQERQRGLYKTPVYTADVGMTGTFFYPEEFFEGKENAEFHSPYIVLGIKDVRGLGKTVEFLWNDVPVLPQAGTNLSNPSYGIHMYLDRQVFSDKEPGNGPYKADFKISFSLKGTKSFNFIPTAYQAHLSMTSDWTAPSFQGEFFPSEYNVTNEGFDAQWETSMLATNIMQKFTACEGLGQCKNFENTNFGANLFQSVDVYQKTMRSVKYGMMFVVFVFTAFIVFEALKSVRVHPVQYILLLGALSLFYLLLLSLSEHMPFLGAYIIATIAICSLLGYYTANVVRNSRNGVLFAGIIAFLYGALFFILQSEDYALLIGSALLFAVLASVMVLTRKVDWYHIGKERND